MNLLYTAKQNPSDQRPWLLFFSLLLSLGVHLLVVLPLLQPQETTLLQQRPPTIVHLIEVPEIASELQQKEPSVFEIDQQPPKPPAKIPVESLRKADRDQQVEQEQAPKGKDTRDQTTKPATATFPSRQQPKPQTGAEQQQPPIDARITTRTEQKEAAKTTQQITPTSATQPTLPKALPPLVSPELLRPDFNTLERIARGSQGVRDRVKERKDVEIGDTVWLNLQHNLLVSFFRRFHDQIELVWNYPAKAARNGIEGTLQLLIIVDREGELLDVDLIQTSHSDLLDFEAIQAVYRAAPFGPLTKHYPHEQLKIRAHFRYQLGGQFIFGK